MLADKKKRLLPMGLIALAAGLILHNWLRGDYADSAAGFLIGISIVFMIFAFVGRGRRTAE
ncbi:MAG TPA: hypothetical protein VGS27_08635 [Candidatus Sulfotelmatobacter sp.]|nr:hypothetical protein [Candidatus Sulfotelmatobacter sp.]